jgi:superfamily II DNA/RNA helicase
VWDNLPPAGEDSRTTTGVDARFVVMGAEATRGVDLPGATHVFVAMRPSSALDYVHFAGRVGRMGVKGVAASLMRRGDVRHVNDFCEAVGVDFRVERRKFAQVDAMQGHYAERP